MGINLERHLRVGKDMPTNADGHIVHPRYFPELPAAAREAYIQRWRAWAANWTKADWPPGLEEFLVQHARRTDAR